MSADETRIVLGPEYDDALREALKQVLRGMGATLEDDTWAVAGSQELDSMVCVVEGQRVKVESETYIGLSLAGPAGLVERIRDAVAQVRS